MARLLSFFGYVLMATTGSAHIGRTQMQQPIVNGNSIPVNPFGYTKNIGPISWYGMSSNNSLCATGSGQSPINIDTNNSTWTRRGLLINVPLIPSAEIGNIGNTIEVILTGLGTVSYPWWAPEQHVYTIQNLHFHTPSEHRINGGHREVEMHMVFKDSNGAYAVLSQMYTVSPTGNADPLIAGVLKNLAQVAVPGSTSTTGPLDFSMMYQMWANIQSWNYTGSLTTPPCTENVKWFVHAYELYIDVPTYILLRNIMGFNARVLQNEHGGENLLIGNGKALKANGVI